MKYDFTSIMDRKGKDAIAVEFGKWFAPELPPSDFDPIPMWIADMNFPTVPTIPKAIIERAEHPAYGYFYPRDEYFDSIINWHETRHGVTGLTKKCIGYENGLIGGILSALNVLCSKGDNVLLHSPAYNGFTFSLKNSGYNAVLSPLKKDENNVWRMDFDDMEDKIAKNHIHAAIFYSPHNPTGRVWEQWELEQFIELCKKYDVYVVSDEIWSDIILPGYKHIPTQSINEDARNRTVAYYAPSKTFNLAGLVGSYHIVYNPWLRDRIKKESSLSHYNDMNVLSMHALIGAYTPEGQEWVDELCEVIEENIDFASNYVKTHFDGVEFSRPEGTYMFFIDCTKWCEEHHKTIDELYQSALDVGVVWQNGRIYYAPNSLRLNLALPLSRVQEAFDRLDKYVFNR